MSPADRSLVAAEALEQALGDPLDDHLAGSFRASVCADQDGRFPQQLCTAALEWGLAEHLLPTQLGGQLQSLETCLALSRVLSRRDLTAAIAFGASMLASIPVWLRGNAPQREAVGQALREGGFLAFALSERDHGADIAASEVTAHRNAAGDWCIDGVKWLINNAGHAVGVTVAARTGTGLRGLTLFLLLDTDADTQRWTRLQKIKTHGVRGSALGGISLSGQPAGSGSIIGKLGEGMEILLKTLEITRVLVAGFALGALDTCLRVAISFSHSRRLYGQPILELEPVVRRLVDAYADVLIGETLAVAACRAAHIRPDQLPLMSACVKYLVPQLSNDSIEALSVVLGARSYLAEGLWHGIFEKMRRDCAVTSLFDGSAPVNLSSILGQLPSLARARDKRTVGVLPAALFARLPTELPWIAEQNLDLGTDFDAVHAGIDAARSVIEHEVVTEHSRELLTLLERFTIETVLLDKEIEKNTADTDWQRSGAAHDLAARYCHLHAAGACALKWLSWRMESSDSFISSGAWLVLCLRRLAVRLGLETVAFDGVERAAMARLEQAYDRHQMFSDLDFQLSVSAKEK